MNNPKFLNLYNPEENEVFEFDMDTIDRIIIAPARELIDSERRKSENIDPTDMAVRIQFKEDSSKEYSLRRYEMEFIYPWREIYEIPGQRKI